MIFQDELPRSAMTVGPDDGGSALELAHGLTALPDGPREGREGRVGSARLLAARRRVSPPAPVSETKAPAVGLHQGHPGESSGRNVALTARTNAAPYTCGAR